MNETPAAAESLLGLLDMCGDYVAFATGIKQQFLDRGWSELAAEDLVIEMITNANNKQREAN